MEKKIDMKSWRNQILCQIWKPTTGDNERNISPWTTTTKEELSLLDNHNLQQQPEEAQLEEEEVEHREEVHEPPEYTTIVYQDKVGVIS